MNNPFYGAQFRVVEAPKPNALDRLREQRKPTVTSIPQKPKPVTDDQLLAIVEQLAASFDSLREYARDTREHVQRNTNRLERFKNGGVFTRLFGVKWWNA